MRGPLQKPEVKCDFPPHVETLRWIMFSFCPAGWVILQQSEFQLQRLFKIKQSEASPSAKKTPIVVEDGPCCTNGVGLSSCNVPKIQISCHMSIYLGVGNSYSGSLVSYFKRNRAQHVHSLQLSDCFSRSFRIPSPTA